MWEEKLKVYNALVARCSRFKPKAKTKTYSSAKVYMFSLFNKDCEIGIRFTKAVQEKYTEEFLTTLYKLYGAVMKGYILIPERIWDDLDILANYRNESYDYIMSLESKSL